MQDHKMTASGVPGFTCWDGASESSLAQALSLPITECMEVALIDGNQYSRLVLRPRTGGCLRLALTALSAYRLKVVGVFVDAVAARLELSQDLSERVRTAVQEAVVNSMLHGNLVISSHSFYNLESLVTSHETIEMLLTSPEIARSMIRVEAIWNSTMLYVLVRDSGAGFNKNKLPTPDERQKAGHHSNGRGLAILEAFCDRIALLDGGATIKMGFRLRADRS